jgi:hypothetical protein
MTISGTAGFDRPAKLGAIYDGSALLRLLTALAPRGVGLVTNINAAVGRLARLAVDQPLLDVGGEGVEGLVDVDVALGRDLEEGYAELVGEGLALLGRDDPLLVPVALVSDQDLVDALSRVLLDVCEPGADVCGRERQSVFVFPCNVQTSRRVT